MTKEMQKKIIDAHVKKLFPGVKIDIRENRRKQRKQAIYADKPNLIFIKPIDEMSFCIERSQIFASSEKKLINDLFEIAEEYSHLKESTQEYLNTVSLTRVIARTLVDGKESIYSEEEIVSKIITTLEKWSAETYEGNRIAVSFGYNPENTSKGIMIDEYSSLDCGKVITNGYDTIVEFGSGGQCVGYDGLKIEDVSLAPYRYSAFCAYTKDNKKQAFVLNRNGEILIFKDGRLHYAKRRGEWRSFSHSSVLKKMTFSNKSFKNEVKNSIYQSMLDVSFARCGACIGYVQDSERRNFDKAKMVKTTELLNGGLSKKTKVIRKAIAGRKFQTLDRRLRQEILGIDGATIISRDGEILAAGTILNLAQEESSSAIGGARRAAALCLRKYGMSTKISADGEITVFGKKNDEEFSFA